MPKDFMMNLGDIQPSQLYISSKKLESVLAWFTPEDAASYSPLPVKELNGKVIFTDGHTRAYAAYLKGVKTIKAYWDEDEMDWDTYQVCVDWCASEEIYSIKDLAGRVIDREQYEVLWLQRCREMHEQFGL